MVRKFLPPPEDAEDPKVPSQTVTQSQILTQEPTNLFPQTLSGAPDDDIAETDGLRGQRQLTTGIGAGREQAICIEPWREGEVNSTPETQLGTTIQPPLSQRQNDCTEEVLVNHPTHRRTFRPFRFPERQGVWASLVTFHSHNPPPMSSPGCMLGDISMALSKLFLWKPPLTFTSFDCSQMAIS